MKKPENFKQSIERIVELKRQLAQERIKVRELIIKGCKEDYKQGEGLRSIGRKYGISPNTVKKYIPMRKDKIQGVHL